LNHLPLHNHCITEAFATFALVSALDARLWIYLTAPVPGTVIAV